MGILKIGGDSVCAFTKETVLHPGYTVTINNKEHQQISAHLEKYIVDEVDKTETFVTGPAYAKFKLHLYINTTDAGYSHGALSWTPNTFVNGGYLTSDLTVNVEDATEIDVPLPSGYEDYYLHNGITNFYDDTNYDNYVTRANLSDNIAIYDLDNYLNQGKSMASLFNGCTEVTGIYLATLNTSNVTNMNSIFSGCSGLTSLDVRTFDTTNAKYMDSTFKGCSGLTTLDVSNFNTGSVTDFSEMFSGCSGLASLDVSNFNTSSATNMGSMFYECSGLTSLDVSTWITNNTTSIGGLFYNCSNLTSIDVSNFNTSNVTNMANVFRGCSNLTSIDASNWDTSKVVKMNYMFANCQNLVAVDLSNWDTSSVEDRTSWTHNNNMRYMFSGCPSLRYIIIGSPTFKFEMKASSEFPINDECKILVPQALISTFQNATNWTTHASKFDAIENYTITRSNGQVTVTPNN